MKTDDLVVTMEDVCAAGLCAAGSKTWFRAHGLDFAAFLRGGMTVKQLAALNDAMAQLAIEARIKREESTWEAAKAAELR